jgi:hypothetical protein
MRSAISEKEINIRESQRAVSRPSAWGRMLVTSALLLGLSGCATADVRKSTLQPKEEVKVEQTVKTEKSHCSKASKKVTVEQTQLKFTAETCDDWDYVMTYFNDHKLLKKPHLDVNKDLSGVFKQREINLGNDLCPSWVVFGASKETYRIFLATGTTSESGYGPVFLADTGIRVSDSITWRIKQLTNCEWTIRLIDSKDNDSALLLLTNSGEVKELEQ